MTRMEEVVELDIIHLFLVYQLPKEILFIEEHQVDLVVVEEET